jgi:hypothetical protein
VAYLCEMRTTEKGKLIKTITPRLFKEFG